MRRRMGVVLSVLCLGLPLAGAQAQDADQPTGRAAPAALPELLRGRASGARVRVPPAPEEVTALREMESELSRFERSAESYRDTVLALLRREHRRERRARLSGFERRIAAEERLEQRSRDQAIRLLERFVARYPDDESTTPSAMFRLGELYFEDAAAAHGRAYDAYQAELDRRARAGRDTDDLSPPPRDFSRTVALYRQLVARFPRHGAIDGARYVLGYCLQEMGQTTEARVAWLGLVCANRSQLGETTYEGCTPSVTSRRFLAETWLRIGEQHFDDEPAEGSMALAIEAYRQVAAMPEDRNHTLGLYKLAWAYYLAGRHRESVQHFARLLDHIDGRARTAGQAASAGAELREEALRYLAIALAEPDWDGDARPDPVTASERLHDGSLVPQDRDWTREVYVELARAETDEGHPRDAATLLEEVLRRWPNAQQAPRVTMSLARAYERAGDREGSLRALAMLPAFALGGEWQRRNADYPAAQREGALLAERALLEIARTHHQAAQRARSTDGRTTPEANRQYGQAIDAYRRYLQAYPNSAESYEARYALGEALYWSEQHADAARELALVRDSDLDDSHRAAAGFLAVEAHARAVEAATRGGSLTLPAGLPAPSGSPPRVAPTDVPIVVQRWMQARQAYLERVDDAHDRQRLRAAYAFNNALLLSRYGYWDAARERLRATYVAECDRSPAGRDAYMALRDMAVALNDADAAAELARDLLSRRCSFQSGAPPAPDPDTIDCEDARRLRDPMCFAPDDVQGPILRRAMGLFRDAERATGERQRALYLDAGRRFEGFFARSPRASDAPRALSNAGLAYQRAGYSERAMRVHRRIVSEVGPRRGRTPEEQRTLDEVVATARFRIGLDAERLFDPETAIASYTELTESPRFRETTSEVARSRREDAVANAARLLESLREHERAAQYYRRFAEVTRDENDRISALYRAAEMSYLRRDWQGTVREMRSFLSANEQNPRAGELSVSAHGRIAQAFGALGRDREQMQAFADTVASFARSRQPAGSLAASVAAEARFAIEERQARTFDTFAIRPTGATPADIRASLDRQIATGADRVGALSRGYAEVSSYRSAVWTVAARARTGRAFERLARAIVDAPLVLGRDLERQMSRLPPDERAALRAEIEDQWRANLDQRARPLECRALAEYALSVRAARAGDIASDHTRDALERLSAYGEDRLVECLSAPETAGGPYRPGEFARIPAGMTREPARATAPPLASPQ